MFEVATEAELCYLPELVGTIRVQLITLRLMVENVLSMQVFFYHLSSHNHRTLLLIHVKITTEI